PARMRGPGPSSNVAGQLTGVSGRGRGIGPFGRDGAEGSTGRVLTSVIPGTGHLLPLLPTLHALRDAGDTVLVASAEPLRAEVGAAGADLRVRAPPCHEADA